MRRHQTICPFATACSSATAEPALPGRWWRPREGEAPKAFRGESSVVIFRNECTALADEEVEIGAFISLQHMVNVELPVAGRQRRRRRGPLRHTGLELLVADQQLQP